jgi:hypothetical protein
MGAYEFQQMMRERASAMDHQLKASETGSLARACLDDALRAIDSCSTGPKLNRDQLAARWAADLLETF